MTHQCKDCSKQMRIAGQAFTTFKCKCCDRDQQHANTAVPRICYLCSEKLGLCQRCCRLIDSQSKFPCFFDWNDSSLCFVHNPKKELLGTLTTRYWKKWTWEQNDGIIMSRGCLSQILQVMDKLGGGD